TFYKCLKLKRLELPYGLTKIDSEAFYQCGSLEMIKIPESVNHISHDAFYGAERVKIVGIVNSYAHNFSKEAYRQLYTGESVPETKGIDFIAQEFVSKNTKVMVDGEEVSFMVYNINGNNYFKLRDIARALKGTDKAFAIEWKESELNLVSNKEYEGVESEPIFFSPQKSAAHITSIKLSRDGNAIDVKTYNLGGNTYFKLRDLGWILGFDVDWNQKMMVIDTRRG
ncbi:MAG: leucine-rich repeat protein, partial [Filifactor alocis]|nr:leucine-rich repeat protein [Filifactor alocis]